MGHGIAPAVSQRNWNSTAQVGILVQQRHNSTVNLLTVRSEFLTAVIMEFCWNVTTNVSEKPATSNVMVLPSTSMLLITIYWSDKLF